MDCHAVFVKTARNDGQRKRILLFRNDVCFPQIYPQKQNFRKFLLNFSLIETFLKYNLLKFTIN